MTQAPLFIALHLIGLAIVFAVGPRRHRALACALAFPAGLASTVLIALCLLAIGIPCNGWTLGAAVGVAVVATIVVRRPARPDAADVRLAAIWTAGFAVLAVLASYRNVSMMNFDSHHMVMLARIVADEGTLEPRTLAELQSWGVFQVVAQSFEGLTRQDYLYALQPVFGLSFLSIFVLALWHGAGRLGATGPARVAAVALVATAMSTIYAFALHGVFIHTNLGTAVYLFGYVVLFWLAEVEEDASALPLAFLFLVALAIQRLETPVVALIALIATVIPSRLPRRTVTPALAAFTVFVAGWYVLLAFHVPRNSLFLTPTRAVVVAAMAFGFFVWWMLSPRPRMRWLNRHLHWVVAGLFVLGLAATFALKADHMVESTKALAINLFTLPHWGHSAYLIAALLVLSLALPRPPGARAFTLTIWLTLAYTLILGFPREPYRVALLDSANRMTIHILPLIFFYLGVRAIPVVAGRDDRA